MLEQLNAAFDEIWNAAPLMIRGNTALKERARAQFLELLSSAAQKAGTPEGVRALIAIHKIGRILISAKVIAQDPDPSPEAIANMIEQLISRLQGAQPTT